MASSSKSAAKASGISKIPTIEASLRGKPYNPNGLVPLLQLARDPAPDVVHKAIWALHRVFIDYIGEGKVGGISDGPRRNMSQADEEEEARGPTEAKEVKSWVRDRLLDYVEILSGLVRDRELGLRKSALPLLFALLAPLSASVSEDPTIHIPFFRLILRAILEPSPSLRGAKPAHGSDGAASFRWTIDERNQAQDSVGTVPEDIIQTAHEDFWAKYDDLRWAFFREVPHILKFLRTTPDLAINVLGQLLPLTNLPRVQDDINTFFISSLTTRPSSSSVSLATSKRAKKKSKKQAEPEILPDWMATYESDPSDDDTVGPKKRQRTSQLSIHASIHSIPSHQTLYSTLWETVLSTLQMDEQWTRKILLALHGKNGILSHMKPERRVRVADWLGSLVDQGGPKAMLAMNGLFVLMTKFNLDYPNFYQRLYGLLDDEVLHVKYRARFFRLLDTFLASPLLPSVMVASFIKRLSRLSLTAPPAGIIMVIPFIYNLFKRHPACMVMIQRPALDQDEEYKDPYNASDPSPFTANAMGSSCWELMSLQNHYLASVSTLAKMFNEVFTKPEYNMEDFLDHGYGTLFETEVKRHIKRPPAVSDIVEGFQPLGHIFPDGSINGDARAGDDIVSRMWTF
ncbi:CBF/Mak21 family-domain-containing protein [Kockovaella imperatae]|uniref:CBF/Mak21 family-domain-containing protein n=1 Tax=Kockovaella imperatae TaxID=4999 RepID=A0A1Y1UDQ8_9TREE|nr:CBF/Mak21 family-domain-containing protein [Kockovaella imperatae]ORX36119.1 CBF/Mak21 family-domain-containing protein [Kockovaella imperatae]